MSLYIIPMLALLLTLAVPEPRLPSRWLGALALIAIYSVVSLASGYLSGYFFGLVEASG